MNVFFYINMIKLEYLKCILGIELLRLSLEQSSNRLFQICCKTFDADGILSTFK